ncbi:MAG: 3,4-dihydroxy-2-butanone-4-phosphate synthase, partial [Verrucomicrobiota bacterium]|nr:3,4-dihydroxy-2-butanone-4-phosphate synthase [Verrucomicrobiota bacterium]
MATKKKTAKKKTPTRDKTPFDSIESIISDIRRGKIVIVVDDEDRENEGDLV